MFGSVPKTLWGKAIGADEKNRIPLCARVLVIESSAGTILADCGNGEKWSDKERDIFAIHSLTGKPIRELVPDVSHLILTHLHFDHAAGLSYRDSAGELRLSYPNAVHYLNRENLERAKAPGARERGSYLQDTVTPLLQANLKLTADGEEILPGITVYQSNGHTRGLQWLLIEDGGDKIAFPSDLIPTSHHVSIPWVMGYDLHAEKTMEEKEKFLARAVEENWLVIFQHDREVESGRISRDERGRFIVSSVGQDLS